MRDLDPDALIAASQKLWTIIPRARDWEALDIIEKSVVTDHTASIVNAYLEALEVKP